MTHHEHDRDILMNIEEGMDVFDTNGDKVGTVDRVFFGSEEADDPGPERATAPDPEVRGESLLDTVADAFDPEDIPEEVRERFLRMGFIRIDGGLIFDKDHYAMPDQIDRVTSDGVHLRVSGEDLYSL